jgi:hypothetical protein
VAKITLHHPLGVFTEVFQKGERVPRVSEADTDEAYFLLVHWERVPGPEFRKEKRETKITEPFTLKDKRDGKVFWSNEPGVAIEVYRGN